MRATVTSTDPGYLPGGEPDPDLLLALADDMAPLRPSDTQVYATAVSASQAGLAFNWIQLGTSVGTPAELLLELAGIKAAIRTWFDKQPDEVLREAAAYSARLTELWTELRLLETAGNRQYTQMRTMQVTPVQEEIDRQYKFAQSRIAMMRQDIDLTKGAGA